MLLKEGNACHIYLRRPKNKKIYILWADEISTIFVFIIFKSFLSFFFKVSEDELKIKIVNRAAYKIRNWDLEQKVCIDLQK